MSENGSGPSNSGTSCKQSCCSRASKQLKVLSTGASLKSRGYKVLKRGKLRVGRIPLGLDLTRLYI